mmetsp:Transcript_1261/g.3522  ORF Transcript_1261/g.3522 Transcript_1261/m.3522 type:complete len:228 (+) Transcript_1261:718-1401(+)
MAKRDKPPQQYSTADSSVKNGTHCALESGGAPWAYICWHRGFVREGISLLLLSCMRLLYSVSGLVSESDLGPFFLLLHAGYVWILSADSFPKVTWAPFCSFAACGFCLDSVCDSFPKMTSRAFPAIGIGGMRNGRPRPLSKRWRTSHDVPPPCAHHVRTRRALNAREPPERERGHDRIAGMMLFMYDGAGVSEYCGIKTRRPARGDGVTRRSPSAIRHSPRHCRGIR